MRQNICGDITLGDKTYAHTNTNDYNICCLIGPVTTYTHTYITNGIPFQSFLHSNPSITTLFVCISIPFYNVACVRFYSTLFLFFSLFHSTHAIFILTDANLYNEENVGGRRRREHLTESNGRLVLSRVNVCCYSSMEMKVRLQLTLNINNRDITGRVDNYFSWMYYRQSGVNIALLYDIIMS